MPIFRVKSVKIYTGQKNLHGYMRGIRDKYEVCESTFPETRKKVFHIQDKYEIVFENCDQSCPAIITEHLGL